MKFKKFTLKENLLYLASVAAADLGTLSFYSVKIVNTHKNKKNSKYLSTTYLWNVYVKQTI